MKPFLLLQSRPEDVASDNEYEAFWRFGGLKPEQLQRVRMDKREFPLINVTEYSGIIMGGGPANFAYSEAKKSVMQKQFEPWLFAQLEEIIKKDIPFLGTCLGFGALVKAMNGDVTFDYGEPVKAVEVVVSGDGLNDTLLKGLPPIFPAFVGHKEGVGHLPDGVTELARSASCSQMVRVGSNVYATQFHPELDGPGLALRIQIYRDAGYFKPEEADSLVTMALEAQVEWPVYILREFVKSYAS